MAEDDKVVILQPSARTDHITDDGRELQQLPYPFYVRADQSCGVGLEMYELAGFQNRLDVQQIDVSFGDFWDEPGIAAGKYVVTKDKNGTYATWEIAIDSVTEAVEVSQEFAELVSGSLGVPMVADELKPVLEGLPETSADLEDLPEVSCDERGVTVKFGDGVSMRMLRDGTIRIRAKNHTVAVDWVSSNPAADRPSVVGMKLTRK